MTEVVDDTTCGTCDKPANEVQHFVWKGVIYCSEECIPPPTSEDCIDHRGEGCRGSIEYRMPLSGTGKSFPRCDGAWSERLDREEETRRRYGHPDSATPPPGFDPTYAGESWSDD